MMVTFAEAAVINVDEVVDKLDECPPDERYPDADPKPCNNVAALAVVNSSAAELEPGAGPPIMVVVPALRLLLINRFSSPSEWVCCLPSCWRFFHSLLEVHLKLD